MIVLLNTKNLQNIMLEVAKTRENSKSKSLQFLIKNTLYHLEYLAICGII